MFPDFNEIKKYTGVYRAKNFELFQEDLKDRGMGDQGEQFKMPSGQLQALCYKNEIEKAMRTPGYAGFELLSLNEDYGLWAAEAAKEEGAWFVDLNKEIADRYDAEGEVKVSSTYFATVDHTHTSEADAHMNAQCVVRGLKKTEKCPLNKYLLPVK